MRSAIATALKPMSMRSDTWLCRRSWTLMGSSPHAAHLLLISWRRWFFVKGKILYPRLSFGMDARKSASSSARNSGMATSLLDFGVFGDVMTSLLLIRW